MTLLYLFAALAAVFALALLVLPTVRVLQGRLHPRSVMGLWMSGAGFGLLALAGLVLEGDAAQTAVLVGVVATILGWLSQRSTLMAAQAEEEGAAPDEGAGSEGGSGGTPGPASGTSKRVPERSRSSDF